MYTVRVGEKSFDIVVSDDGFVVDGQQVKWDLVAVREGYFHVILNGKSFRAEMVDAGANGKQVLIKVNGRQYPVELKDKIDLLLEKLGMNTGAGSKLNHIRAPMPGLIIQMKVKDGDEVKAGDTLLILEAMKMENIIKAPGDGIVRSVKVSMGDGVEKNQVLIEF